MVIRLVLLMLFYIINLDKCFATTFDVMRYGATGDGYTDDSQAFLKAWKDTCECTSSTAIMLVPAKRTFFLNPLLFNGPCISKAPQIQIGGTLVAPKGINMWKGCVMNSWIVFFRVNGLSVYGNGILNGNGLSWWQTNMHNYLQYNDINMQLNDINIESFRYNLPATKCYPRPTLLSFSQCDHLLLEGLTHINPPRNHISISDCNSVMISQVKIFAPKDSHNTDGIDIALSTNISIIYSIMKTGDDCVAINNGCSNILIKGVQCGPGHGISVGSVGKNGEYAHVEGIMVKNCTFTESTNGGRIKTWPGGNGYVRNITFKDILLYNTENPIIIDQHYCDTHHCPEQQKAVEVSDVKYINIKGTSTTKSAITLDCSDHIPCTNIVLQNVNISSSFGDDTYSTVNNAAGWSSFTVPDVTFKQ